MRIFCNLVDFHQFNLHLGYPCKEMGGASRLWPDHIIHTVLCLYMPCTTTSVITTIKCTVERIFNKYNLYAIYLDFSILLQTTPTLTKTLHGSKHVSLINLSNSFTSLSSFVGSGSPSHFRLIYFV